MSNGRFFAVALLAASAGVNIAAPARAEDPAPAVGSVAPVFRLADVHGKMRALADYRGRPVALFYFCGCPACAEVAREWAQLQRGGALGPPRGPARAPATLVVYDLDAESTRLLAAGSGMDPAQTAWLPDPEERVTRDVYRVDPCPRVFVLDGKSVLRYTNQSKDDAPQKAPALVIVSRALDALRTLAAAKPAPIRVNSKSDSAR